VVVAGCANTGKSSLVRALTNAAPEVSEAPFTTWEPLPGMLRVAGVPVQLVDTPPLDAPFVEPELFQLIRRADLLLLVVDLRADPFQQVDETLARLAEHRIVPRAPGVEPEERQAAVPVLVLANKCDDERAERDCQVFAELLERDLPILPVSASSGRNLDRLGAEIVARLNVIRVYAKPPGREPDLDAPFVVKAGSLLSDLGALIHKDFLKHLKFARVWGSAVHPGQMVAHDYVLQDGDVVELHV
jgi:ribosome-interacting GTPase 1